MTTRQFALFVVCGVVAAFIGGLVGQAAFHGGAAVAADPAIPTALTAQSFVLVNAEGQKCGVLGTKQGLPILSMTGPAGELQLGVLKNGPSVKLHVPDSKPIILDQRGLVGMDPQPSP